MAATATQLFLVRFSQRASRIVIVIGGLVLIGWLFNLPVLRSGVPHLKSMNPLTAILFILAGMALVRSTAGRKGPDRITLLCAVIITLGGLAKVFESTFGYDSDFDRVLFRGQMSTPGQIGPSEIAMNTAVSFVFCGLALLLLDVETRRGFRPAQACVIIVGLIALLALIGYAYRVLPLYQIGSRVPMALNSAIGFELFSLAALAARPERGFMTPVTSDTTGGAMARRLLPAAVLIPLVLGALGFSGEKNRAFEIEFGISLFAFANIVLFTAVIWWNAKLLFVAEQERLEAMQKLKQLTTDLKRSNTELQQFAYIASHDLTEPLRMITSYLGLLDNSAGAKLGAEEREFMDVAVDGAKRMQGLIQDLLEYARVDTLSRPFEPTNCDDVLESALSNLKVAVREGHAIIEHQPLPTVSGDRVQLTQVFQNLIGNAIKFHGPDTPRVRVGARRDNGEWVFHVQDNGIGIDPKNFNRIFALFQRLHTRREYPGTGIGLAICKKIIERHGGRIWAESKPNEGSTFYFTVPANGDETPRK